MTISPSTTQRSGSSALTAATTSGKYRVIGFSLRLPISTSSPSRKMIDRKPSHFGSYTRPGGIARHRLRQHRRDGRHDGQLHVPIFTRPQHASASRLKQSQGETMGRQVKVRDRCCRGRPRSGGVVQEFELLVVGSGPGGQRAAIAAAKLGKRVAIVDRKGMVGGVCVNTGTIPSKTLREAVLYLTGTNQRELYGASYQVKEDITVSDLPARTQHVIARETEVVRTQLHPQPREAGHRARPSFSTRTRCSVDGADRGERALSRRPKIVIATGTRPARPREVAFDGARVSTPTASSSWTRCPTRWSWSGPGSSASSTPRCSPRSGPASRSWSGGHHDRLCGPASSWSR